MTYETTHSDAKDPTRTSTLASAIREMPTLDAMTALLVRIEKGIDPTSNTRNDRFDLTEGRDGEEAVVRVSALITDEGSRDLYGEAFRVRLPLRAMRHRDRNCAAALAILALPEEATSTASMAA